MNTYFYKSQKNIEENFITCKLIGSGKFDGYHNFGLGNQMFQIAAALSFSEENKIKAIFPDLKLKKFGNYKENIFNKLDTTNYKEDQILYEYYEPGFDYSKIPSYKNIRIHGYFQSEKYFKSNKELIVKTFEPNKDIKKYINQKYKNILDNSVSCHVRIGDFKKLEDHHPLLIKTNYYKTALQKFENKNILVFSDDIASCKKEEIFKKDNVYFIEGETDIVDLYLMSKCKDNIIANSTFSWWGAWLNNNEDKKVYAPLNWFGPSKKVEDKDILPSSWLKIAN